MRHSRTTLLTGVNTRRRSCPDAGFTLVELMITLVLVGIVLSIAVPAISGYLDNTNLKSAARALQSDIAYLRESAMTESSDGTKYCIQFDAAANKVYLQYEPGGGGTLLPVVNYPATRNLSDSGSGIYISNTTYTGQVKIYQRGFIGTPGTVEITNNRGSRATLTLLSTGKVYVTYSMQ
jgi:prepilin-type N-terminal cleavage/methylation domain-containing protein